jgi:lipopolysaccharide biosynthesis protein
VLTNDSIFAPLYPKRMQEILQQNGKGILGMTDSYEIDYHLQSYFLMVFKDALLSDVFWEFWHSVKMLPMTYKQWIIRKYEIGFTQKMLRAGFSAQAIYKIDKIAENYYQYHQGSKTIRKINPTHKFYRQLIELKAPILKRDLWKRNPDFRNTRFWEDLVSRTDYDIGYIKDYLRKT